MKDSIFKRLIETDGIVSVYVGNIRSGEGIQTPGDVWYEMSRSAIRMVKASGEVSLSILVGEKGPNQRKIVAAIWPNHEVAVEVVPGHKVTKSLQRLLRRTCRKFDSVRVESAHWTNPSRSTPCEKEQPAPSSNAQTEPSSPSPEESTPSTGQSPEAG